MGGYKTKKVVGTLGKVKKNNGILCYLKCYLTVHLVLIFTSAVPILNMAVWNRPVAWPPYERTADPNNFTLNSSLPQE